MASIEFIEKRIEGKRKEVDKLQKKLERIEKAEASGWKNNPYYYTASDKKFTVRDLEKAQNDLETYKAELIKANEKAESRNVKAIIEFLEIWKTHVNNFYETMFEKYKVAYKEYCEEDRKYCEWFNHGGWKDPNKKEIESEHRKATKKFHETWSFIDRYLDRKLNQERTAYELVLNKEKLTKELENEANAKYDDIIQRTNEIAGKITDASALSVGEKGELNGYIIGERGTARVNTIGAGGYNIQCFHFRTLVHKLN